MPEGFVPYGQLRRCGVTPQVIRGFGQTRRPDEVWTMTTSVRSKLGGLLRDIGFDTARDVLVREVPQQHVFRLTQRSNEEERRQGPEERRTGRLQWLEGTDHQ